MKQSKIQIISKKNNEIIEKNNCKYAKSKTKYR